MTEFTALPFRAEDLGVSSQYSCIKPLGLDKVPKCCHEGCPEYVPKKGQYCEAHYAQALRREAFGD